MADARGEYWYFNDDVDAAKITVPELRSILLKHGVQYPSSAKKPILLGLFHANVLPQASKLQQAQARTKRSTRGIQDVPSSQASTTMDDAEDETLLAPPTTTRRTSRRTTRATTEEEQERPVSRGKTPSRTVPTKHARASDEEPEEQPAMRRNRKSVTPAVRPESRGPLSRSNYNDDESPFTQDNPFQSGSSPPAPESRDRRRKTLGSEHKEKRKSDTSRRRTFQPKVEQLDDVVVPSRRTFDVPLKQSNTKEEDWIDPSGGDTGEEFTPEEQLELVRERAKSGAVDILPPRRRKKPSKASGTLKAMSLTTLLTAALALGGVWRQEKYSVGFCGIGKESSSLAGVDVPEWAESIIPQCEPCPPHATCYLNLDVVCDKDFVKKEHPLAIGGLVPLPPTCEPDSEKTRRVTLVADRAVHVLRQRKAQFECGETDVEGNSVDSAEVKISDLKQELSSLKRKGMSQEEFENLFTDAIGEVVRREEVVENNDGYLASNTEPMESESSHQILSPSSPSDAASNDPSDKRLNDIFGSLL